MTDQCQVCGRRHGHEHKKIVEVNDGDTINLNERTKNLRSKIHRIVFVGQRKVVYESVLTQISKDWTYEYHKQLNTVTITGEVIDNMTNFSNHVGRIMVLGKHHPMAVGFIVKGYGVGALVRAKIPNTKKMKFNPRIGESYKLCDIPKVKLEGETKLCVGYNNVDVM